MSDADGRIRLVDMLSTRATGTEGINLDILIIDIDFNRVVNFRKHKDGTERGVPAIVGVVRGQPNETMDSAFRLQVAVGVVPLDRQGCTLQAGIVSRLVVCKFNLEPFVFTVAQ